ncbi:MAG: spore coat protein CotH, partial [Rhodopirellula bahusiensis]
MLRFSHVRPAVLLFAGAALIGGPGCSPNIQAQPPGFGPGGPGGPNQQDQELVEKFDTDDNAWLNDAERKEAREFLAENPVQRGFGGPGGGRGPGQGRGPEGGRDRGEGRGGDFGPPPGFGPPEGFGPPPGFGPPSDFGPPQGDGAR